MLLELTLPPSLAAVAAVYLLRTKPTAARVGTLEARVVELTREQENLNATVTTMRKDMDRVVNNQFGVM